MEILFLIILSQINIDIARFKASNNFTLCQVYISLAYSDLFYKKEGDIFKSAFKIKLSLKTPDAEEITQEWDKISYISSYEEAESRKLHMLEELDLLLSPGKYNMKVEIVSDSISKSVEKSFEIGLPQTTLYLSDIELATSIEPVDTPGKFIKNEMKIIPNPQGVFGERYPILYAYTEIYNLEPGSKYEVNYHIFNELSELLYELPPETLSAPSEDVTGVGAVNVAAFKEGIYTLKAKVTQNERTASKEKTFRVAKGVKKKEFRLTAEELKYYDLIKYVASPKEVDFYNTLPDHAKHEFLINFWERAGRPLLHTLIERVKYADDNFSSVIEKGRDSDMGRIWIRYGKPDEIERYTFDPTYHPCEKWQYFGRGGIVFIFVDKLNSGKYELIYSSIPEEPTEADYKDWVNPDALE